MVESRAPIEETEVSFPTKANDSDTQWTCILKEILNDFGISRVLSIYKSLMISDETSLCCYLAFDVLPFCVDVLGISPFNISFRLNRYAGNNGRCPHKELLRRWFM